MTDLEKIEGPSEEQVNLEEWCLRAYSYISCRNGFCVSNLTGDPVNQFVKYLAEYVKEHPILKE